MARRQLNGHTQQTTNLKTGITTAKEKCKGIEEHFRGIFWSQVIPVWKKQLLKGSVACKCTI
jgi:hypothetical protein